MRHFVTILTLLLLFIFASCQNDNSIVGTKWIAEKKMMHCIDTLSFNSIDSFTHYDCETSWHFDGKFKTSVDTIYFEIILQQFEVDNYKDLEPTAFWTLINRGDYLELVYLAHKRKGEIIEVSEEVYDMIGNFKKIESN